MDYCQGAEWKPRESTKVPGTCGACGAPLEGRNRWFCKAAISRACRMRYLTNHHLGYARSAALKRDGKRCRRCGDERKSSPLEGARAISLEVNHIAPRRGGGYLIGCHNHLDSLETLCHIHHLEVTATQHRSVERDGALQSQMDLVTAPPPEA